MLYYLGEELLGQLILYPLEVRQSIYMDADLGGRGINSGGETKS